MPADPSSVSPSEREIEAVARAWWAHEPAAFDSLDGRFRQLQLTRAKAAIAALDRVRDACGDDEAAVWRSMLDRIRIHGASGLWTGEDCAIGAVAALEGGDAGRAFMLERESRVRDARGDEGQGPGIVYIARCPEHGLHGERDTCFVCDGPVEQVPMRPLYSDASSRVDGGVLLDDARQALDAWRATEGLGPSRLDDEDLMAEAVIGYAHRLRLAARSPQGEDHEAERRAEIEAFLRDTLAKTGWSDPMINGLLTDLQPYLDRVRDARGDDEGPTGYTRVRNDELARLMLADAHADRLQAELQALVDWFNEAPFLRAERLLYDLYRASSAPADYGEIVSHHPEGPDQIVSPQGEDDEAARLRAAAKRVLEADMRGVRDLDALNALEDAAGFSQQRDVAGGS